MIVRQHIGDPQRSEVTIGTFPLSIRCCRMNGSQSRDKKYLKKKKKLFQRMFLPRVSTRQNCERCAVPYNKT